MFTDHLRTEQLSSLCFVIPNSTLEARMVATVFCDYSTNNLHLQICGWCSLEQDFIPAKSSNCKVRTPSTLMHRQFIKARTVFLLMRQYTCWGTNPVTYAYLSVKSRLHTDIV